MYLETMQRVLSQSSKVLMDGKAGNVLYLPLDKLQSSLSPSNTTNEKRAGNDNVVNQDGHDSSSLFDGREIMRPIEHLGRSNG